MRRALVITSLLVIFAACGDAASRADTTLATSLAATNAARDAFVSWDEEHQLDIVHRASTPEAAQEALRTYRNTRQKVIQAFTSAYTTIAAAAALIPLVDAGKASEVELLRLLADAAQATALAKQAIESIRGDP